MSSFVWSDSPIIHPKQPSSDELIDINLDGPDDPDVNRIRDAYRFPARYDGVHTPVYPKNDDLGRFAASGYDPPQKDGQAIAKAVDAKALAKALDSAFDSAVKSSNVQPELNDNAPRLTGKKTAAEAGWTKPVPIDYEAAMSVEPYKPIYHTEAKYEYNGDIGDVGPPDPALEESLYNKKFRVEAGVGMINLMKLSVVIESQNHLWRIEEWDKAGLHPIMLDIVRDKLGYKRPTPIQQYTIPAVTHGADLVAVAQTGSGKTAAYLVPVISRLMGRAKKWAVPRPNPDQFNAATDAIRSEPLVLVLVPTRELAWQVYDEARRLCYRSMLRPGVAYGGVPRSANIEELQKGIDILIGTPGRIRDLVENSSRWLSLRRVKYTILDEADEMVQENWSEQMKSIIGGAATNLDDDHHYMMFSATFNKASRELARHFLESTYIKIRVGRPGSAHENVVQTAIFVQEDLKLQALYDLLTTMPPSRTLIFCNSNAKCDIVDDALHNSAFPCTGLNSSRTQTEREDSIRSFRSGKTPIMVASAIAARGLDVKNILHVINFDLPSMANGGIGEYIHRIGRTARAGNKGQATSFYNERNEDIADSLVNVMLETNQVIPSFLQGFIDPSGKAVFENDDSDDEVHYDKGHTSNPTETGAALTTTAAAEDDAW